MLVHASCAARLGLDGSEAVLLVGPPGAGKSDLVLRLIHAGWGLVADDQVVVEDGVASAPAALAGVLEVRGLGLFRLPYVASARLRLVCCGARGRCCSRRSSAIGGRSARPGRSIRRGRRVDRPRG